MGVNWRCRKKSGWELITVSGLLLIAVAFLPVNVMAETDPEQKIPKVTATHIQMMPMMTPAGRTSAPVTFFLEAKTVKQVVGICNRIPRLRDALLSVLSREPIPVKSRRLVLDGVEKRLLAPLNKALEKNDIRRIFITPGVVQLGHGKIKTRPRAIIDGCANILKIDEERKKAEQALKEK